MYIYPVCKLNSFVVFLLISQQLIIISQEYYIWPFTLCTISQAIDAIHTMAN